MQVAQQVETRIRSATKRYVWAGRDRKQAGKQSDRYWEVSKRADDS